MADDPWAAAGFKEGAPPDPGQVPSAPPKLDPWAAAGFKDAVPAAGPFSETRASGASVPREAVLDNHPQPSSLLQSHYDAELAARQGVNPNALSKSFPAQDYSSSPLAGAAPKNAPKKLGYVDMGAEYEMPTYTTPDGNVLGVNFRHDFIARDPETGHMAVYARNEQTDENRAVSASRLIMPGLAVGPLPGGMGSTPEIAGAARAVQAMPHSSAPPPAAVAQAIAQRTAEAAPQATRAEMAAQHAAEIGSDVESFDRLNVRKPPITFAEGPMAGVGQMVSRIPGVGSPIHNSLDQALVGAKNAADIIASEMAPARGVERAGQALQSGLERFRTAGVNTVEPGQLAELGIQPRSPGPYMGELVSPMRGSAAEAQLGPQVVVMPSGSLMRYDPQQHVVLNDAGRLAVYGNTHRGDPLMSQGARQRIEQAAPVRDQIPGAGLARTNRGVEVLAARPLDQIMMGRRSASDLTDAELAQLVRSPASNTSFQSRAEGLYEKARRGVPNFVRSDESEAAARLAAPNTRAALQGLDQDIANQIAGQGTISGDLANRLRDWRSHFSLDDLFAIRTEVGRAFGNLNPLQATLNRRQLGNLYAGLSRDIEVGLQDIANRAYIRARPGNNNHPSYIPPETARRADQALRDFRTADRYYRQGVGSIERFSRILGTDNPQEAVGMLMRAALDGEKGNMGTLRSALGALRPAERQEIASLILERMGKPTGSARGLIESTGFSPASFMTRMNNMDPAARDLLFGGEYSQAINDLTRVVKRLANQQALANTSRSGTDIINYATMIGSGAMMMHGQTWLLGSLLGPMAAFSVMFSRPEYVRMVQKYAELRAAAARAPTTVTAPRMVAMINQLNRAAIKDPALLPAVQALSAENGVGERRKENQPVH